MVDEFADALKQAGLTLGSQHDAIVRSFVASVATKRFVILTGMSGSGKTQLAIRFAEWLGKDALLPLAVRPDWTGAEALFGFEDILQQAVEGKRAWNVPRALQFMLDAARSEDKPYLLLLDEMNLAHVERYFADVLSGMESDQPCLPNLERDAHGTWRQLNSEAETIRMPRNLIVIGTVNVDETTYMFSPKVLDRANTFEFRVGTEDLGASAKRIARVEPGSPSLIREFLAIAKDPDWHVSHPSPSEQELAVHLRRLHGLLTRFGFEFGHRTFVEAIRFGALLAAAGEDDPLVALDLQIMQKILPRIHGSRRRVEGLLSALERFCVNPEDVGDQATEPLATGGVDRLPTSASKVRRMSELLLLNQFVSFTE